MQTGQHVNYYDADGTRYDAEITEVVGTGKSLFKILDVRGRTEGEEWTAQGVLHENDAEEGGAFWLEKGARPRAEPVAPADEEVGGAMSLSDKGRSRARGESRKSAK